MLKKIDLNSAEVETVQVYKNPVTVITANGEVQTNEIASFHASVFSSTGKPVARVRSEEVNKDMNPTPRFARKSSAWNPPLMYKEFIRKLIWLITKDPRSRNCISINSSHIPRFRVGR